MAEISTTKFNLSIDGVSSALGVSRFEASEAVSSLFAAKVTIVSEDMDIALASAVGKGATLTISADSGGSETPLRYLNGIVSRFRQADAGKKICVYEATIVPTLWRLQHRVDARIFQAQAVPDILQAVLKGGGVTSLRLALTGSYSAREYCVQYRESDFAFVSRLMEEEGIYYWFEHSEGDHVLVLADNANAPTAISGDPTIAWKGTLGSMAAGDSVSRFTSGQEVRTGKVTLTDFNFKKPSLSLLESTSATDDPDLETYDYPGEYEVPGDGTAYAKVRLEEQQARKIVAEGDTGCGRLVPGFTFTMADHPREAENIKYLITGLTSHGAQSVMGETGGGEAPSFKNTFHAMPATVPYRPERTTPRPTVKGVQTAIVTGAGGEEVHVDEFGRVKVHFHWDRLGKSDDTSSCWIRVSQVWAGAGWGAMWIPRVGHEVIVDFLEGDPDRPIITGRVYHGANVPPYPLPAEKTKSTIKSNSSIGGGGNNELRFEDKKGQEEIWLHGQKDWNIKIEHDKNQLVGNDETKKVGHDETLEVDNNRSRLVKNDETVEVDHNRSKTVKNNETETIGVDKNISVGHSHAESIGKDMSLSVGGDQTATIGGNQTISVGGTMDLSVGGSMSVSAASLSETISGSSGESVSASKTLSVDDSYTITVSKQMSLTVSEDLKEEIQKQRSMIVGEKLTVQCGDATITVEKNGNVTVEGKQIVIKGDGPIQVQGKKLEVKSDGTVNVEASGNVQIKGSNVSVN